MVEFLSLQLFLDQGERYEWFDSTFITMVGITALVTLAGFLIRELTAEEPVLAALADHRGPADQPHGPADPARHLDQPSTRATQW